MAVSDINEVLTQLPHRYPFLLVDRVIECTPGESIIVLKIVTYNEQFFQGHFPNKPVMPAVLILEAMAQAAGILAQSTSESGLNERTIYYFVGVEKARFRKPVEPGDQLFIEVHQRRVVRGIVKVSAVARVDGVTVASADLMGAIREIDD